MGRQTAEKNGWIRWETAEIGDSVGVNATGTTKNMLSG